MNHMHLAGNSNPVRFSSGGAQAASNMYYLNWLEKQKKEKEALAQQQAASMPQIPQCQVPLAQDCFQSRLALYGGS